MSSCFRCSGETIKTLGLTIIERRDMNIKNKKIGLPYFLPWNMRKYNFQATKTSQFLDRKIYNLKF